MDNILKIAFLFSATNRTGGAMSAIDQKLQKLSAGAARLNAMGTKMMKGGGILAGGALTAIAALGAKFADFEKSQIVLENTLRRADGTVSPYFAKLSKISEKLGTQLPGTTQDFFELASGMLKAGTAVESLAGGALEAAAALGAVIDIPYAEAGVYIAKFQQALGIADRDLVKFADTVQRTAHLGVEVGQMQYAFGKMAGPLKTLGLQGLDSANRLSPLVAMLIRTGRSGEEAGTSLGNIFTIGLTEGLFRDMDGMLAYFDKVGKLDAYNRQVQLQTIFGKGGASDVAAIIANEGVAGYQNLSKVMADQASLDQRKTASLRGLTALWEAMTGTIENIGVTLGSVFGPELAEIFKKINAVADAVNGWANRNKTLVSVIAKVTLGAGLFFLTVGAGMKVMAFSIGVLKAVKGAIIGVQMALAAAKTMSLIFSTVFGVSMNLAKIAMISTGIGALVVGLGIGAVLLVQNWDKVKAFFSNLWGAIGPKLQPMFDFFAKLWEVVSGAVAGVGKALGIKGGGAVRTVNPRGPAMAGGSLNYAPVVNINGSASKEDIRAELKRHKGEIYRMNESERRRAARRGY